MIETFSEKDRVLVRYLFNELDKNEAVELEDEMLLNDELFDRAQVVEMNLIDHYLRNELTPEESLHFQTKFLAVPENRDKVNRAQLFHDSLRLLHGKDQFAPQPTPARGFRSSLAFVFQRPLPALASIAAAILLIAGLVLVLRIPRRVNNANTLVTGSSPPATGKVNETTGTPSPNAAPLNTPFPNVPSPNDERGGTAITLAKNDRDRFTQREYVSRQNWNGGERGGRVVHITLRQPVTNLVLMYELLDDKASQRGTYGVTIKNQYSERVWPQNDRLKEEVKPVLTAGKNRRKLIVVDVPTSVFKDGGPYLFEIDGPYLPAKHFTVKKLKAPR
jgi:hypothetical protein